MQSFRRMDRCLLQPSHLLGPVHTLLAGAWAAAAVVEEAPAPLECQA